MGSSREAGSECVAGTRRDVGSVNLVNLMIFGPLGGATKQKPDVVHAITIESGMVGCTKGQTVEAVCGKKRVFFLTDPERRVMLWPIAAKGPLTRCHDCWIATGKKRPRKAVDS
jgi:hypothetical protein